MPVKRYVRDNVERVKYQYRVMNGFLIFKLNLIDAGSFDIQMSHDHAESGDYPGVGDRVLNAVIDGATRGDTFVGPSGDRMTLVSGLHLDVTISTDEYTDFTTISLPIDSSVLISNIYTYTQCTSDGIEQHSYAYLKKFNNIDMGKHFGIHTLFDVESLGDAKDVRRAVLSDWWQSRII